MSLIPRGLISPWWYSPRRLWRKSRQLRLAQPWEPRLTTYHVKQYLLEARWSLVCFSAESTVPVSLELTPAHSELWGLSTSLFEMWANGKFPNFYLRADFTLAPSWRKLVTRGKSWAFILLVVWHRTALGIPGVYESKHIKSFCQTLDHDHNGCYWKQCQPSLDLLWWPPVKQFLCCPPIQTLPGSSWGS